MIEDFDNGWSTVDLDRLHHDSSTTIDMFEGVLGTLGPEQTVPSPSSPWLSVFNNSTGASRENTMEAEESSYHSDSRQDGLSLPDSLSLPEQYATTASGLLLSALDHQAIQYYSTVFSFVHVLKSPASSTNAQLLWLSTGDEVIMRFVLAVSLNEMCHGMCGGSDIIRGLAEQHFQTGSCLFARAIERDVKNTDGHLSILASAFFSYIYLSRRKRVARSSLQMLSNIVSEYAKRSDLCDSPPQLGTTSSPTVPPSASHKTRALLSRLVRWNFFKDIQMSFHGCGGNFASYINKSHERPEDLQYNSYALLDGDWEQQ